MQYKSWSKIKICRQLKTVGKLGDELDVAILKQLLDDSVVPFDGEIYLNTKTFNKELLDEYSYFLPYIEQIADVPTFKIVNYPNIRIPIKSQLKFVYHLFETIAPEWIELFNNVYKERKRNLKYAYSGNYSVYLSSIEYSYISINRNSEIDDLFNLIHEYTHTIVDRIYYRLSYFSHYPFIELPSLSVEFVSSIIMKDYYLDINEGSDAYLMSILNIVIDYANNIINMKKVLDGNASYDITSCHHSLIHDLSYVIPFLYVFELFYLYLDSRSDWINIQESIINFEDSTNYLEEMKKLGLTPNRNLNRFIDDLNNHRVF